LSFIRQPITKTAGQLFFTKLADGEKLENRTPSRIGEIRKQSLRAQKSMGCARRKSIADQHE
jgi:hypothetical protein